MKILHTSDWHLGRSLYDKKRTDEINSFLTWLLNTLDEDKIDVLIVSGDIFDTTTPNTNAQKQYYQFLVQASKTNCQHIIIVGGNHDSPSFLNAPKGILESINVHVIGAISEDINDEMIVLRNEQEEAQAIICAVPYLRDRDVRRAISGESIKDKGENLRNGIINHYNSIAERASKLKEEYDVPVIATGHLFTYQGKTNTDDGVRDLYVGSLANVDQSAFDPIFDYVALGHLHIAQTVGGKENIRYSGSPIPMGFGEANQDKIVVVVDFENDEPFINLKLIPNFQKLIPIKAEYETVVDMLHKLKADNANAWIEIELTKTALEMDINEKLNSIVEDTEITILNIRNKILIEKALSGNIETEALEQLTEEEVFARRLLQDEYSDEEVAELTQTYKEALLLLSEGDKS